MKTKQQAPEGVETFPLKVKRAGVSVTIYRTQQTKVNVTYDAFLVADYTSGKRVLRSFADLADAKRTALEVAERTARGEQDVLTMRNTDRASYLRAVELLRPTGIAIEVAAGTFAQAFKILGGDFILDAARHYATRNPAKLTSRTVREVVDELVAVRTSNGSSPRYLRDLTYRLGRLADDFACPISSVDGGKIQAWLDGLEVGAQSRVNFTKVFSVLFSFAIKRGYLPKGWDELDRLDTPKVTRGEVSTFTPDELARLLNAADHAFLPGLAVQAFCGLRTSEVQRLSWEDVHLAERFLEVKAAKSKTGSRRTVPICDAAAQWLAPFAHKTGMIWTEGNAAFHAAQRDTAAKAGVQWHQNALRHSFVSYRLAIIKNAAAVSLEAGNSPAMIFAHYHQLVRPEAAARWFAVAPERPANIASLPAVATA